MSCDKTFQQKCSTISVFSVRIIVCSKALGMSNIKFSKVVTPSGQEPKTASEVNAINIACFEYA